LRTYGLGGDSAVQLDLHSFQSNLTLGPRRLVPIAMLASHWPERVHASLDAQLSETRAADHDACFILRIRGAKAAGLAPREAGLLERLSDEPVPLAEVVSNRMDLTAIEGIRARGLVQIAGVTPTDASHVIDLQSGFDKGAAEKALTLFARQKTGSGEPVADTPQELATDIIARLHHQTAETMLESGFAEDELEAPEQLVAQLLTQRALQGKQGIVAQSLGLSVPVIGLGASAATYYPPIERMLGCKMLLPKAGGVANAVGAVVGHVTLRCQISITAPSEGLFLVHSGAEPERFTDETKALAHAEKTLTKTLKAQAQASGADSVTLSIHPEIKTSTIESREVFIEATLSGEATGRPRVAT